MANAFITIKEIARQALPRLIENLVFPNLVHKDFSNDDFSKISTPPFSQPCHNTPNNARKVISDYKPDYFAAGKELRLIFEGVVRQYQAGAHKYFKNFS